MKILGLPFAFGVAVAAQLLSRADGAMQTTVALYDNSPCSAPPHTMTVTRELSCTPQVNHSDPLCEDSGTAHYVKDCTRYNQGGWDDYGLISNAFGSNTSYLILEEYDWYWCDSNYLINATAYVLDEACHSNIAGTMSTKFSMGRSLTLTTYEDPNCVAAVNATEITHAMLSHQRCVGNARRYYLRGPSSSMTAVAVFEDSSCSEKPVGIKITLDFVCGAGRVPARTVCGSDGGTLYSISSCTNDYPGLASTVFGNSTPYIVVEEFMEGDCSQAQTVTVYIADGACHSNTDDATSFKATLTTEATATITTYTDTYCHDVQGNIDVSKKMFTSYTCVNSGNCVSDSGYGCGKKFSVGGLGGPPPMGRMTSYAVYDTDSCSQPAQTVMMTRELTCTPQVNHSDPLCEDSGTAHYVKDCTRYNQGGWDDYGLISNAFGSNTSYLILEEYDWYWCDSNYLINATAYVLDEACHSNIAGTMSTKFSMGRSLTLTTYEDPNCVAAVNATEITHAMLSHQRCVGNARRYYLRGPSSSMTAVAVFEDSSCSEKPVGIKITLDFVCGAGRVPARTVCGSDGGTLYSISSCTNDYPGLASTVFGNSTPYIVVEEFMEGDCSQAQTVTVYIADGACHSNTDDATSFKATLTTEATATITTYTDTYCHDVQGNIDVSKKMFTSYTCVNSGNCVSDSGYGCGKKFSVGGLGGPPPMGRMTSYAVYDTDSCSQPAQTVMMTRELTCTPQVNHSDPLCEDSGTAHYVKDCTRYNQGGWDDYGLISNAFGSNTSYLILEEYDWYWCDSNYLINATAYVLDEACHSNIAGTMSTKFSMGRSLTLTTYEDPNCVAAVNATEITHAMLSHQRCVGNARRYYLRGPSSSMTAVAVFEDSSCSEKPVGIKITLDFVCGAGRVPARTVCGSDGGTLYSISSCTNDYPGLASTVFGNSTPYIVVEEFMEGDCSQAQTVTVYIADGACHSNTDDATSFKATLTTEATATITTYTDTYCHDVQGNIDVSKKMFTSYTCVNSGNCVSDSGYGCGKKFSVGGLNGAGGPSLMKAAVLYDTKDCGSVPVELTAHPVRSCLASTGSTCQKVDWSYTLYQASECVDDVSEFAASNFGSIPYLMVENYAADTNCQTQKSAVVYKADGKCHPRASDGTYFKITPSFGTSLTIATYPTSSCSDFDVEYVTVGTKFINTGRCFNRNLRFYANMSALFAPSPPPMVDVESLTREQIMFPEWLWEPTPRRVFQSD